MVKNMMKKITPLGALSITTAILCGIYLSAIFPLFGELGIWCGIITFVMCMSSNFKLFDFCPGIFMGCFTTFAANGQWKGLVLALVIGAFLGIACDYSGMWLYKAIRKE